MFTKQNYLSGSDPGKIRKLLLLGLFFIPALLFAQNDNYFYARDGSKQPIEVNYNYISVSSSVEETSDEALRTFENEKKVEDQIFRQSADGKRTAYSLVRISEKNDVQPEEYYSNVADLRKKGFKVEPVYGKEKIVQSFDYFYVKLRSEDDLKTLTDLAQEMNCGLVEKVQHMPKWYKVYCTSDSKSSVELANLMFESGHFAKTDPAFALEFEYTCSNEPEFSNQWYLHSNDPSIFDINICPAWDLAKGSGSTIALLDNGIDPSYSEFQNTLLPTSFDATSGSSPSVYYGSHGEEVATVMAGNENGSITVGVAPEASILDVSINTSSSNTGFSDQAAQGISWAWQNGAEVINNSWGIDIGNNPGMQSVLLEDAINDALTLGRSGLGCVVVFSSGNDYWTNDVRYPADINDDILVIGATLDVGVRRTASNYSSKIDLVAPGDGILTSSSSFGLTTSSGTSMAAPQVSGVAALILSMNKCLTGVEVNDIIESTCNKIPGGPFGLFYSYSNVSGRPNGTWNNELGYGLLDAGAALQLAESLSPKLNKTAIACREFDFEILYPGTTFSVQWDFGDGTFSTSPQATHLYTSDGQYTVTATVNAASCTQTLTTTIDLDINQDVADAGPDKNACPGLCTTIGTPGGQNSTYEWYKVKYYGNTATYTTVPGNTSQICVNQGGSPYSTIDYQVVATNLNTGCVTNDWVTLTTLPQNSNSCLIVETPTPGGPPNIVLAPNPTNDHVSVLLTGFGSGEKNIRIVNSFGLTVHEVDTGSSNEQIDLSGLGMGVYVVIVMGNSYTDSEQLVIMP